MELNLGKLNLDAVQTTLVISAWKWLANWPLHGTILVATVLTDEVTRSVTVIKSVCAGESAESFDIPFASSVKHFLQYLCLQFLFGKAHLDSGGRIHSLYIVYTALGSVRTGLLLSVVEVGSTLSLLKQLLPWLFHKFSKNHMHRNWGKKNNRHQQ